MNDLPPQTPEDLLARPRLLLPEGWTTLPIVPCPEPEFGFARGTWLQLRSDDPEAALLAWELPMGVHLLHLPRVLLSAMRDPRLWWPSQLILLSLLEVGFVVTAEADVELLIGGEGEFNEHFERGTTIRVSPPAGLGDVDCRWAFVLRCRA